MDVIGKWTGHAASQLQDALRMTNLAFADRLGVAERTVAGWHSKPGIVPRPEMQAALDTLYERADALVRSRFMEALRPAVSAQALRVAIAIVRRGSDVLLVCRRGDASLSWQFPAGMVKPGRTPAVVAVEETHAETGVRCAVRQHLGTRIHPVTGVVADYQLAEYLMGEATNRDDRENDAVAWVPIADLTRFIAADKIYPPILEVLA
ncbi:NUDIX hydrolase [Streptomyces lunaelactis]|uniref:NUDIX hydrolase n=1 Tax=Streptomyces lunaelactis TaxID=1535768 RepID=UPI0015851FF9|nr:NUDIX domain-containing protein [Streptomyces lunaelactis]NUL14491.1 NUDIX domain-containing protein [Streptomyces lunaelactis]